MFYTSTAYYIWIKHHPVYLKRFICCSMLISIILAAGCKAKKCPTYDGDGAKHHVNYSKKGLVKKKGGRGPARPWDSNY